MVQSNYMNNNLDKNLKYLLKECHSVKLVLLQGFQEIVLLEVLVLVLYIDLTLINFIK